MQIKFLEKQLEGKPAFVTLAIYVLNSVPSKTDAEIMQKHELYSKLHAADSGVDLSESEVALLRSCYEKMRDADKVIGIDWYYFVKPITVAS